LVKRPETLKLLRERPELLPPAIEEVIRYSPAVHFTHRIAKEDIQIRDKIIKKGQLTFFGLAAANRDPRVFTEPDVFDITRPVGRHISFGAGIHSCVGLGLGRRELEVGYELLFKRMPELRLDEDDPPKRRANGLTFRGFSRLPLRF
jgi:cytochrome P450